MSKIREINTKLNSKEISAVELTTIYLDNLEKTSSIIGSYISTTKKEALAKAKMVDAQIAKGEEIGLLAGVPMGIKDNISTTGIETTCGSKILAGYKPIYNATVVERLYAAGGIILGKCNMDEFAMGSSNENSAYGIVKNPWDLTRVPGGSSGGSAATVAAREVVFSLGSDTGGSIRQPAGFCGVVGMKPTYGRVSRYGLIAYASSLDQIGPMANSVEDCAIVHDIISGYDRLDSTSANMKATSTLAALTKDIKGLKIGIPKEYFQGDEKVLATIRKALAKYEELGAIVEETSLPNTEYALAAYYIIASAEASSNLARFDGVRYGARDGSKKDVTEMMSGTRDKFFGQEVKKRIMIGTYALSSGYYDAYYLKALKARTILKRDFDQAFAKYDVLITPIAPTLPFKLGENIKDSITMYLGDICTVTINLVGIPGITIPCGFADGLPVGMQILGKPFSEELLFNVAHSFEQNTNYNSFKPEVAINE
ncbi:MAG: Asp-tRNA(Asn)/Glu-tRNA(Gln) amidotransferase subunit GatA [Fusobacteria bacterium]|nr:Asp-tRNA(Asn)/Glu-tRNA(Gln) amidotransferase subunit GatA [Fusobacteriota bacterium]